MNLNTNFILAWTSILAFNIYACKKPSLETSLKMAGGSPVDSYDSVGQSTVKLYVGNNECSGVIISTYAILTAAHCAKGTTPLNNTVVAFGVSIDTTNKITAKDFIPHPSYRDNVTDPNDIAIVFLKQKIPEGFIPRPLIETTTILSTNTVLTAAGFGLLSLNNPQDRTNRLMQVSLKISAIKARHIYAVSSDPTDTHRHSCSGDSGGPAFLYDNNNNNTLSVAAIVVASPQDCLGTIFLDVRPHLRWIAKVLKARAIPN